MNRINKVEVAKVICKDCEIEYSQNQYYLSRIEGQERMDVCKTCFQKEFKNNYLECLKKYNIPFIKKMWDISENNCGLYLKNITLPQFSKLQWKDSKFEDEDVIVEKNFYDGIVKNLKSEAVKLNDKLIGIREYLYSNGYQNKGYDMNLYISTLKSLRDTLDLISKYDWRLMYSEYETNSGRPLSSDPSVKQVAVWEQNHDNQIKNHKIWNVVDALDVAISTKESGESISESLDIINKLCEQVRVEADNWEKEKRLKEFNKSLDDAEIKINEKLDSLNSLITSSSDSKIKTYSIEITEDSVGVADTLSKMYPEMFKSFHGVYIGTGEPVKTLQITI